MPDNYKDNREGRAKVLTPDEVEEILLEARPKFKLLFAICYYTSCRISEALKLEVKDLKHGTVTFRPQNTKTRSRRQIKIHPELQEIINEIGIPKDGYIFPANPRNRKDGVSKSSHMLRQTADKELRRICDYLGIIGASTHSFRRTGITSLFNDGEEITTIKTYTGHKSLEVLDMYIEASPEKVDKAVMKLGLKRKKEGRAEQS